MFVLLLRFGVARPSQRLCVCAVVRDWRGWQTGCALLLCAGSSSCSRVVYIYNINKYVCMYLGNFLIAYWPLVVGALRSPYCWIARACVCVCLCATASASCLIRSVVVAVSVVVAAAAVECAPRGIRFSFFSTFALYARWFGLVSVQYGLFTCAKRFQSNGTFRRATNTYRAWSLFWNITRAFRIQAAKSDSWIIKINANKILKFLSEKQLVLLTLWAGAAPKKSCQCYC